MYVAVSVKRPSTDSADQRRARPTSDGGSYAAGVEVAAGDGGREGRAALWGWAGQSRLESVSGLLMNGAPAGLVC